MSDVQTSAGSKLFISATLPATYTIAAFQALTYTEIGEVTDLGEFGRQYNLVTHNSLSQRRTVKRKGSYNDGTIAAQMARVPNDVGQAILQAARDSDNSYSIKIVLQDGSTFFMSAQIMSYTIGVGSSEQITGATVNIEIDNDILEAGVLSGVLSAINVSPTAVTVQVGKSVQLLAYADPVNASNVVTWSSAEPTNASVNSSGLVTGLVIDASVIITATSVINPGISDTCVVTVVA